MTHQFAIVTKTVTLPMGGVPFTEDFTDPSITEPFKAAVLIFANTATDDTNVTHGILGIGFIGVDGVQGESSLQVAVTANIDAADPTPDNETDRFVTGCVLTTDGSAAGIRDVIADFDSAISGGFRLEFTQLDVSIKVTALIFAGLAKAATGACGNTSFPTTFSEGVGAAADQFEPDLVIFRSSDNTTTTDTSGATIALGFALNRDSIPQKSAYINWADAPDPTDSDGYLRSDCASSAFEGTLRTHMDRFIITAFTSTGFNGTPVDTGAINSPQANYLALKFDDAEQATLGLAVANAAVSGSVGAQTFTQAGFRPFVVLGMSTLLTAEDTLTDGSTASSAGLFMFTADAERAASIHNEENFAINPGNQNAGTRQGDHAVLTLAHDGAVAQQASLTEMTSSGFTLNFSTATAGFLTYLAIGSSETTLVSDDTEQISDQGIVILNRNATIPSEVVQISESCVTVLADVPMEAADPAGWVFDAAVASRGAVLDLPSGAVAGTVLG